MNRICLLPIPKKMELTGEKYVVLPHQTISISDLSVFSAANRLKDVLRDTLHKECPIMIREQDDRAQAIRFCPDDHLSAQAYEIAIVKTGILIRYSEPVGAFYAVSTLKQLLVCSGTSLPGLHIYDQPAFENRGLMVDISRCKVPRMETLYHIVDMMADLKLNQLQLYIEGFSFAYPSFEKYWKNLTPVTGEEIARLDQYCRQRYIDLVPTQNNFGHMGAWLAQKEFRHLAECENGFLFNGSFFGSPLCLNPLDPESFELVRQLTDDLLCCFSSRYYNVSCDETLELGQGKSKEAVEQKGLGRIYLDFLLKIHGLVQAHGKKMMFWGDIIQKYPDLIPRLPKDSISLEWGYDENEPKEEYCRRFSQSGIPFYVCPGTGAWNSLLGKTQQMIRNITNAAELGLKYGAAGLLNTDWGDEGHWQPLPVSYAGYAFGAAMSWGPDNNRDITNLEDCLNLHIFHDKNGIMGKFVLDAGNYYLQEEKQPANITHMVWLLYRGMDSSEALEGTTVQGFKKVIRYLQKEEDMLRHADMRCADAELIHEEYEYAIHLACLAAKIGAFRLHGCRNRQTAGELADETGDILYRFKKIWLSRNRTSRIAESMSRLEEYQKTFQEKSVISSH